MDEPIGQRVVCAAIKAEDGEVICSARHFDELMRSQIERSAFKFEYWNAAEQGFIDQRGKFLTRHEAHDIAAANGQIIRRCGGDHDKLFSENLY